MPVVWAKPVNVERRRNREIKEFRIGIMK